MTGALRAGLRPHAIWTIFGIISVVSMWFAYTTPGAIVMFTCIGLAFVLWRVLGSRGSWVALIVVGSLMGGLQGWQAVTGSRCPEGDTKVFLKEGKPPVGCDEFRAVAAVMGSFFGLIALIGVAAPFYARRVDEDEPIADERADLPVS